MRSIVLACLCAVFSLPVLAEESSVLPVDMPIAPKVESSFVERLTGNKTSDQTINDPGLARRPSMALPGDVPDIGVKAHLMTLTTPLPYTPVMNGDAISLHIEGISKGTAFLDVIPCQESTLSEVALSISAAGYSSITVCHPDQSSGFEMISPATNFTRVAIPSFFEDVLIRRRSDGLYFKLSFQAKIENFRPIITDLSLWKCGSKETDCP